MSRIWSTEQEAIFDTGVNGECHLVVRARAGTGKTTTIVEMVKRYLTAHPGKKVIVCAFNKKIAEELALRFTGYQGVEVKTLHGLGFAAVLKFWERIPVEKKDQRGQRAKGLTEAVCGQRVPDAIKKLVTRLHTLGREIAPHALTGAQLVDIAMQFDCTPDEDWEADYPVEDIADFAARAMKLAADRRPPFIDFADMIFLPVRHGWVRPAADMVVVDEAQDMTIAQLEIAQGSCRKPSGRMVVVGDDRQAIYGFRGADSGSLDRLLNQLQATELGLTTTYRCGKAIVAEAQTLVPDFQAHESNGEGEIAYLPGSKLIDTVALGDFVLSRTNAPLVSTALRLLRGGKRARIAGRQIGEDLVNLVRKLTRVGSVPTFLERLRGWQERETSRATRSARDAEAAQARVEEIADKAEMLRNLADDARSTSEIIDRAEALFTDDGLGQAGVITCSSVHRAKGLEADRVFVLADTLKNHTTEEQNIRYVAITRAKHLLTYVSKEAA